MVTDVYIRKMRQSTIGNGDICHMRLGHQFHWNPEVTTSTEEAVTGTVAHALMEAYAHHVRDDPQRPMPWDAGTREKIAFTSAQAELETATHGFHWRDDNEHADLDVIVERALDLAEYYVDNHCWWADTHQVLAIEWNFEIPWRPGWVASGTCDLLLMDANGWLVLMDYKFPRNKKRPGWERVRNTPQMAWYKHWLTHWWTEQYPDDNGGDMRPMRLVYEVTSWGTGLDYRQFQPHVTAYEEQFVLRQAHRYADLIEQGPDAAYIPSTNHHLCDHRWCDYYLVCEAGERLNNQ